ncbi:hypothetical protein IOC57_17105 [Bacillus sp. SD075]|nr:hypothetical protein [Bacillus sp. SD075]
MDAGGLSHATFVVFDPEPLGKGHPSWRTENVTVTPHLSSKRGISTKNHCHIRKKQANT